MIFKWMGNWRGTGKWIQKMVCDLLLMMGTDWIETLPDFWWPFLNGYNCSWFVGSRSFWHIQPKLQKLPSLHAAHVGSCWLIPSSHHAEIMETLSESVKCAHTCCCCPMDCAKRNMRNSHPTISKNGTSQWSFCLMWEFIINNCGGLLSYLSTDCSFWNVNLSIMDLFKPWTAQNQTRG